MPRKHLETLTAVALTWAWGSGALAQETLGLSDRPVRESGVSQEVRPKMVVKSLPEVAGATHADPFLSARAESLAARRKAAFITGGAGLSIAVAAAIAAVIVAPKHNCNADTSCMNSNTRRANASSILIATGGGVALSSLIAAFIIHPSKSEILGTIQEWNVRHPEGSQVTPSPTFGGL